MSSIAVRLAAERDFPAIARIQQTSPEAAQWPVGDYSGFEVLLALLHEGRTEVPAGFCAWRQTSLDEAELLNLAVAPEFRRRGVASALLRTLRNEAKGTIFLEVAEPNSAAISLYEHHGWVSTGIRKGYYQNGMLNAIVMEKRP
ncbi:MAG TPA: GNAT family N-acetyltransferase [Bryobacteraceae bacterium]|nr:GNAT family N-acetyltransferase [Bryobacteraceae bacterium]